MTPREDGESRLPTRRDAADRNREAREDPKKKTRRRTNPRPAARSRRIVLDANAHRPREQTARRNRSDARFRPSRRQMPRRLRRRPRRRLRHLHPPPGSRTGSALTSPQLPRRRRRRAPPPSRVRGVAARRGTRRTREESVGRMRRLHPPSTAARRRSRPRSRRRSRRNVSRGRLPGPTVPSRARHGASRAPGVPTAGARSRRRGFRRDARSRRRPVGGGRIESPPTANDTGVSPRESRAPRR